jgi:hypothetical protein
MHVSAEATGVGPSPVYSEVHTVERLLQER